MKWEHADTWIELVYFRSSGRVWINCGYNPFNQKVYQKHENCEMSCIFLGFGVPPCHFTAWHSFMQKFWNNSENKTLCAEVCLSDFCWEFHVIDNWNERNNLQPLHVKYLPKQWKKLVLNVLFHFSLDLGCDCSLQIDLVLYGSWLSLRLGRSPAVYHSKLELSAFPSKWLLHVWE